MTMAYLDSLMPWELQDELHKSVLAQNAIAFSRVMERVQSNLLDPRDKDHRTPLFNACITGNADMIAALIRAGADVNAQDIMGATPLLAAAARGDLQVCRGLCKAGADPTVLGINGLTPSASAEKGGFHEVAEGLKYYEARWRVAYVEKAEWRKRGQTQRTEESKRLIIRKQFGKSWQVVLQLIREREMRELMPDDSDDEEVEQFPRSAHTKEAEGASDSDCASCDELVPDANTGQSFLGEYKYPDPPTPVPTLVVDEDTKEEVEHRLQQQLQEKLVRDHDRALFEEFQRQETRLRTPVANVDVQTPSCQPCTPIGQQNMSGRAPIAPPSVVFESRANIRSLSSLSQLSISQATQSNPNSVCSLPSAIPNSRAQPPLSCTQILQTSEDAFNQLCVAAHTGDLDTCKRMSVITHIDPMLTSGHTPLVWAVVGGHRNVVLWLLKNGADPSRPDTCGYTAIFHAVQHGYDTIVILLAQFDRKLLLAVDNESHNLVQWAAFGGSAATLRLLVEDLGVAVEELDQEGKTCLHWAAQEGHVSALQYLLSRCSVGLPFHKDVSGITAEQQARSMNHSEAAQILLVHCKSLALPFRNM
ncbi:putative 6-phosphofructo-2-kinase/fructose-2,6-biphosphatase [Diplonema papillatum]|nr:putative 6-phosphofructo-2-kinase/fructose-2,6-biphosphatase [Diplonema papillatum]